MPIARPSVASNFQTTGDAMFNFRSVAFIASIFIALGGLASAAHAQVVAFGASNVQGYGVSPSEAFPAQLQGMLQAKGYNVTVQNAGVYGSTSSDMRARLDSAVPQGTKVVLLDVSGPQFNNRFKGISPAEGRADLAAISAALRARGIKIVEVNATGIGPNYRQGDGVHLSPTGHQLMASRLLPQVIRALGGR
jgi:acyl-CoA thioesterase I